MQTKAQEKPKNEKTSLRPRAKLRQIEKEELVTRPGKHYLLTVKALCDTVLGDGTKGAIADEIREILSKYNDSLHQNGDDIDWRKVQVWEDAFLCERLVVKILPRQELSIELARRIYAVKQSDEDLARFYEEHIAVPKEGENLTEAEEEANRALLGRVIRDLQHKQNNREMKKRYSDLAHKRVWVTFVIAFITFVIILPASLQFFTQVPNPDLEQVQEGAIAEGLASGNEPETTERPEFDGDETVNPEIAGDAQ